MDGGHARSHRQSADAALHFYQTLFQHRRGGVHNARVNIARHLEVKQVGAVLRVVKGVGDGLVNGGDSGAACFFRLIACVNGESFYLQLKLNLE